MVQEQVAAAAADAAVPAKDAEQQQPKPFSVKEGMQGIVSLLEKSVKTKETRLLMGRLMRQTAMVRKHMTASDLARFVKTYLPQDSSSAGFLQGYLKQDADVAPMEDDATAAAADAEGGGDAGAASGPSQLPEVELYSYLLVLVYLLDRKHFTQAREVADAAVGLLQQHNRRTLDAIGARIYFYYSWAYECTGALADVRSTLMAAHCTAGLRHDAVGAETLLNLLLRNYLAYNLYDQAEKFRSKAQKADSWRVPGQYCRYLFYLGTIRAIQLEYSEAKEVLQQASRKAPTCAHGFRVACNKWLILVRLLLGEVPEREEFSAPGMRGPLAPYFELTCAVRSGDLAQFRAASDKFAGAFRADRTTNLITRLQYNVIRTGLRRINLAYSRISLKDVAENGAALCGGRGVHLRQGHPRRRHRRGAGPRGRLPGHARADRPLQHQRAAGRVPRAHRVLPQPAQRGGQGDALRARRAQARAGGRQRRQGEHERGGDCARDRGGGGRRAVGSAAAGAWGVQQGGRRSVLIGELMQSSDGQHPQSL